MWIVPFLTVLVTSFNVYGFERNLIEYYESNVFMKNQYHLVLARQARLRLVKIKEMNLIEARKISKKNLHLMRWPDEKKMLFRYVNIILKDIK